MNVLEDLWQGNICPAEEPPYCPEDYKRLIALIERNRSALFQGLTTEQAALFDKFHDCWLELQQNVQRDAFIRGFQLAARLMAASLCTPLEPHT